MSIKQGSTVPVQYYILVAVCYYWQMNVKPMHIAIPSFNSECTSNIACTSAVGACISNHREIIVCHIVCF